MAKEKSKAIILSPDGTGGMSQVQDRRFEDLREWPNFDVPKEQADTWLRYLSAECQRRGWGCCSIGQLDCKENSGSITVNTRGSDQPQLAIVWERNRGGPIKVRYRSAGTTEFPLADAQELFGKVNELCRTGTKERFYCWGQLVYEGLPWRGEMWLDDTLRLGPPSRQEETFLHAPRVILIDAQIDGIDAIDAHSHFAVRLRELSVFLSVVMRREVQVPPNSRREWTYTLSPTGQVECDLRYVGYYEPNRPAGMPARGQVPTVPLVPIHRPDFSLSGIIIGSPGNDQQRLPADILDLWQAFTGLSPDRRQRFWQVASMWQAALSLGHEYQTARFAWMVVACEALKPPEPQYRKHNIYNVVEALLGKPITDLLQEEWFRPQHVRNAHLHAGEFRGSEFVPHAMMPSFQDPTFDQASRVLAQIAPAAIIEWLMRGGSFTMPPLKRRRN